MGKFVPTPAKTGGGIPVQVLKAWAEFVSDSSLDITERISEWSFRVDVAGIRWADMLRTAPATTVLMTEGLVGFAAKTKTTGGESEGRPWGISISFFLTKMALWWLPAVSRNLGGLPPRFWIGRP